MQFWTLDEIERNAMLDPGMADHEVGEEIAPGVTITRRRILQVGIAGAIGLGSASLLAGCASSDCGTRDAAPKDASVDGPSAALTIDQLMADLRPRAQKMIASDSPDEASYLAAVSMLLARYQPEEPWRLREPDKGGFSINALGWMPPVVVFDIRMRPGSTIHLHDHRHYNGVLQCLEGEVRCRNFDIVTDATNPGAPTLDIAGGEVPPEGQDFLIRQNADKTLARGQLSTLSRDRDNIHHVEAGPNGCKLADVFTYFRREARSYELAWDALPTTRNGDTYKVAWKA
ncbi:MAG: hypothetical protein HRU13_05845 [Phycisphaerales bacterium]|nr:hypothetical protein [Phycisphaerales bacterium]